MTDRTPSTSQSRAHLAGHGRGTNVHKETTPEPLAVNAETAAKMLGIGTRSLWSFTACDAVPHVRIGRSVRYRPDELRAWLDLGAPTEPGSAEAVRSAMRVREGGAA